MKKSQSQVRIPLRGSLMVSLSSEIPTITTNDHLTVLATRQRRSLDLSSADPTYPHWSKRRKKPRSRACGRSAPDPGFPYQRQRALRFPDLRTGPQVRNPGPCPANSLRVLPVARLRAAQDSCSGSTPMDPSPSFSQGQPSYRHLLLCTSRRLRAGSPWRLGWLDDRMHWGRIDDII